MEKISYFLELQLLGNNKKQETSVSIIFLCLYHQSWVPPLRRKVPLQSEMNKHCDYFASIDNMLKLHLIDGSFHHKHLIIHSFVNDLNTYRNRWNQQHYLYYVTYPTLFVEYTNRGTNTLLRRIILTKSFWMNSSVSVVIIYLIKLMKCLIYVCK